MPELAEVFFNASKWRAALGLRVERLELRAAARCCRGLDRRTLESVLQGSSFESAHTHGKRMLFGFSGGAWLEAHLGMTGSLAVASGGYEATQHDHLVIRGSGASLVFCDPRQFGSLALQRGEGLPAWWRALPPEPHDERFDWPWFEAVLSGRGRSVLKPLLLKQELFPGIGNWMADEALWQARLDPRRRLGDLSLAERRRLFESLGSVCRGALESVGLDYRDPPASWLFRYRWKDGGSCPESGQPLVRQSIGGRTTCWSPAIQR